MTTLPISRIVVGDRIRQAEKQLTGRRLGTGHIRIAWSEVKRKFPQ